MPVRLDTIRVVGLDVVDWLALFRKLDTKLTLPPQWVICAANFVLSARAVFEKVNIADMVFFRR